MYAIAYLGHSNETPFGDSKFSKLIVWFGMTIGFIPIFLVTLDAGVNSSGNHLHIFRDLWITLGIMDGAYVFIICPLMIAYYEGNENQAIITRVQRAVRSQLPMFLFILLFAVITSFIMRNVYVPEEIAWEVFDDVVITEYISGEDINEEAKKYFVFPTSFGEHIMICTTFVGHLMMMLYSGVG